MKYRHNDNSYSAWGENRFGNATGSLWLTAFVVKSMAQSSAYIVVDKEDILRSARWLVKHQKDDGCFPQVGRVFSSYLKGGLDGDNPAGLSAFALTALVKADLGKEVRRHREFVHPCKFMKKRKHTKDVTCANMSERDFILHPSRHIMAHHIHKFLNKE